MNSLAEKYGDKVAILGFPCNQFGSQEPHDADWIANFVKDKYNVEFPVMEKISVTNKRQSPIYKWLRENSDLKGGDMQWNFEKFLIDQNGEPVKRYSPKFENANITDDIDALLKN